ncbi:MAG TPA: FIST N-terminal domain-containing protein [Anaerolineae bacterium]|nr:FIST N-terminal domain-containing protein [Anaerolineae bacterium]
MFTYSYRQQQVSWQSKRQEQTMQIATAWSSNKDGDRAASDVFAQVRAQLPGRPDLLILFATPNYDGYTLAQFLRHQAPYVPTHGSSSYQGTMTEQGFHSRGGRGLGLMGIYDPMGKFGTGTAVIHQNPRRAGMMATQKAIEQAARFGEPPELLLLAAPMGVEKQVLQGIVDVVGRQIPVVGASAAATKMGADDQFVMGNGRCHAHQVAVTACYPSGSVHVAYHNGFVPTRFQGVVTKAAGRHLLEINGQAAAQVYNEWRQTGLGGLNAGHPDDAYTLTPLAYQLGYQNNHQPHSLAQVVGVTEAEGLALMTAVPEEATVVLMMGTREAMAQRAVRTVQTALLQTQTSVQAIRGGLLIYDAATMLAIHHKMPEVAKQLGQALGGAPFLTTFSFGQQGGFVNHSPSHSNLMIGAILFGR